MKSYNLYMLTFPNGKRYAGITNDFKVRMAVHKRGSRNASKSSQPMLHSAIAKYGWDAIHKRVLVIGDRPYIADLEIRIIAAFDLTNKSFGYNVSYGGDLSPTLNPEVAKKGGMKRRGIPRTNEQKSKISAALMGHAQSEEARRKIGLAGIGRKQSEATIAKKIKAMIGRKHSAESKLLMSMMSIGRPKSDVHRKKLSEALRGRINSPCSADTKSKISEANRRAWARRKANSTQCAEAESLLSDIGLTRP